MKNLLALAGMLHEAYEELEKVKGELVTTNATWDYNYTGDDDSDGRRMA